MYSYHVFTQTWMGQAGVKTVCSLFRSTTFSRSTTWGEQVPNSAQVPHNDVVTTTGSQLFMLLAVTLAYTVTGVPTGAPPSFLQPVRTRPRQLTTYTVTPLSPVNEVRSDKYKCPCTQLVSSASCDCNGSAPELPYEDGGRWVPPPKPA